MKKNLLSRVVFRLCVAAVPLLATATAAHAQQLDPLPVPVVSTDSLMKHIIELGSETYEGRLAGTTGHERAMAYVERVLASYGMSQITEQSFPIECNEVENCKFNIYTPGSKERRYFTLGNEFCCAGMTGRGYVDAQMVFVGYGIDNGVFDEFKGVDVQGKIVVVLTGTPEWLPASIADHYTLLRDKARTAERHGAIGMLAINISPSCLSYEPQSRIYCGELPHLGTFPILQLTMDCGRELLSNEAHDLDAAIATLAGQTTCSFALLKKAEVDVNARYNSRARTANVVARLEGSDRVMRNELIVVGASLDGSGIQGETCLFPGADINASGVAAVLETARILSQSGYSPKRSVLFVLFSGGEQQWLGSREFLAQYPRLSRVEAFLNPQNIGCGDSLVVLGDNHYPTLWEICHSHDTAADRRFMVHAAEKTNPRGDARAFDSRRIPSLVITTYNGLQHNHVSSDIWENINRSILTKATQLLVETTAELADGLYQGRGPKSKGNRY
jgi:hypothetical protein